MNKFQKVSLSIAAVSAIILAGYGLNFEARLEQQVKSGEKELICVFQDGERRVPSNKIVGLHDGVWEFTNGHASACIVK